MRARHAAARLASGLGLVTVVAAVVAACNGLTIAHDATLSGRIEVESFTVKRGVTLTATSTLEVVAKKGDITIDGVIRGRSGSGAGITLSAPRGRIAIAGRVTAGDGADGASMTSTSGQPATGRKGRPGGGIGLTARAGVTITGEVVAGGGGHGGDAIATAAASWVRATSGIGAPGGSVSVSSDWDIEVFGLVRGGQGGDSGGATATTTPGEGIGRTRASAPVERGGDGGSISLVSRRSVRIQSIVGAPGAARVEAGRGGSSGYARAGRWQGPPNHTDDADARVGVGGSGGFVRIAGPSTIARGPGVRVRSGGGGHTGAARAAGRRLADAQVDAGGLPGELRDAARVHGTAGPHGGSGTSRARLRDAQVRADKTVPGTRGSGARRSTGSRARLP